MTTDSKDGIVKHFPDSLSPTGKNIDTRELTRPDGTVVQRQGTWLGDPNYPSAQASVNSGGLTVRQDLIDAMLVELRVISYLLAVGLNVNDDLDTLRNDFWKTL